MNFLGLHHIWIVCSDTTFLYSIMSSKSSIFRSIVQSRKTCRRFEPGRRIPDKIKEDVLNSTLVRYFVDLYLIIIVTSISRCWIERSVWCVFFYFFSLSSHWFLSSFIFQCNIVCLFFFSSRCYHTDFLFSFTFQCNIAEITVQL